MVAGGRGCGGRAKKISLHFIAEGVKKGYIQRNSLLDSLEVHFFGEIVILVIVIVTGEKQSQLLVFWTWLGLEFDNNLNVKCLPVL